MAEEEKEEIIKAGQLNITKAWTWIAGGLGVLGPAIYALFKDFTAAEDKRFVLVSGAAVMIASLFAIAIMVAADLRARATVTAAEQAKEIGVGKEWTSSLRAAVEQLVKPSEDLYRVATSSTIADGVIAPLTAVVGATIKDEGEKPFLLLAVLRDAKAKKSEYLVTRPDGKLEWKADADIKEIRYPYPLKEPTKEAEPRSS